MEQEERYDLNRMVMESHYLDALEKTAVGPDGSFSEMERQMYLDIM